MPALLAGLLMAISLFPVTALAEPPDGSGYVARVAVSFSGEEPVRSKVERCIRRELQTMKDVVLFSENTGESAILRVSAQEVPGGGVVVAYTAMRHFDPANVTILVPDAYRVRATEVLNMAMWDVTHNLAAATPEGLGNICKQFVSEFDTHYLASDRYTFQALHSYFQGTSANRTDEDDW